ncbi:MAG: alpha-L-fucosidase, partial [Ignavibacteriae bacterium]|nr:alpha-L-fucosidase [Ignavibacteriota bacterium]
NRPFNDKRSFKYNVDDYNEYFMNQLFELLTEYGPIHEVWFDGAHPKRKGDQKYTYNQWYDLIRKIAPDAVIFGKGPDVRWCGNEAGETRKSEWSVIPINGTPENWDWPDMTDDDLGSLSKINKCLESGGFLHWYPAETNTSIRDGWFWRNENQHVKTVDEILNVWYNSVGGNSVFLLNIPPNNKGLLAKRDVQVLQDIGNILNKTFSKNLAIGAQVKASSFKDEIHKPENIIDGNLNTCWMTKDWENNAELFISLPEKQKFNRIVLQEQIQDYSQRISEFEIEAMIDNEWVKIANGTTIGYKKICRTSTITADKIKIKILDSRVSPTINNFGLYFEEIQVSNPIISRDKNGLVSIHCNPSGPIIKYSTDGTEPNSNSKIFNKPLKFPTGVIINAIAFDS